MPNFYVLKVCTRWIKISGIPYVGDCVFWYAYEELGNWFVGTLGKIFDVNFLGY